MNQPPILTKWQNLGPYFQSLLRIVAALIFINLGSMKLFAFPAGMPPDGSTAVFLTQVWFGGVLEFFGGALMLVGLCTRPVAFILSGMMAVAYFQFHFPQSFWPSINGGAAAAVYCFVWLCFSATGAGPWSIDARRKRTKQI